MLLPARQTQLRTSCSRTNRRTSAEKSAERPAGPICSGVIISRAFNARALMSVCLFAGICCNGSKQDSNRQQKCHILCLWTCVAARTSAWQNSKCARRMSKPGRPRHLLLQASTFESTEPQLPFRTVLNVWDNCTQLTYSEELPHCRSRSFQLAPSLPPVVALGGILVHQAKWLHAGTLQEGRQIALCNLPPFCLRAFAPDAKSLAQSLLQM